MQSKMLRLLSGLLLLGMAVPAQAESIIQVWSCALLEGKTAAEAEAVTQDCVKAANTMAGGEKMEVYLNRPLVAEAKGGQFQFMMIAPSTGEWGRFMDGYDGSAASEVDKAWNEIAQCSSSSMWVSKKM